MARRIHLFKRFERFWHWSQAALVITLLVTGFEVHGSFSLFGFAQAAETHGVAAWLLVALWVFAIFWHATTGEWRQYVPTLDKIGAVILHYGHGIFLGRPHPYRVVPERKHNPLQRLSYLGLKLAINPLIWVSGLAYLFHAQWRDVAPAWLGLREVALAHTAGAFLMLVFLIAHVYLTTTGATPLAHIKAMITGYEEGH
jgi:thiosulfate reductase cytochrome b subunit